MVMPERKVEPVKPRPSTGQDMMAEMMRSASQKKNTGEKAFGDSSDEDKPEVKPVAPVTSPVENRAPSKKGLFDDDEPAV